MPNEAPPAGPELDDDLKQIEVQILTPQQRLQSAIGRASTLAGAQSELGQEIAAARDAGDEAAVRLLNSRLSVISAHTGQYGSVRVGNLGSGVLGMAPIGGSVSQIYISSGLLMNGSSSKIGEVLLHEHTHTKQAVLQAGDGAVLFTPTQRIEDESVLYEGHTETTTAKRYGKREDMPKNTYEEGYDTFQELSPYSGRLEQAMQSGDVSGLQNDIWKDRLERSDMTAEELGEQAAETGYTISQQVVTMANQQWLVMVEEGKADLRDVRQLAQAAGIDLETGTEARIRDIMTETLREYQQGPDGKRKDFESVN